MNRSMTPVDVTAHQGRPPRVAIISTQTRHGVEALNLFRSICKQPCTCVDASSLNESCTEWALVVVIVDKIEVSLGLLKRLKALTTSLRLFAIVAGSVSEGEVRSIAPLVEDFVVMPVQGEELAARFKRVAERNASVALPALATPSDGLDVQEAFGLRNLIGRDSAFVNLVSRIPRIAESDASVLITGETGTGKELFARAIHHLSPRSDHPFVAVDCGAFPEQLLENELFGHVRGAFTGAHGEHRGLARLAEGGVLFLDEVDALSPAAQGKLLRFLQERTFKPLGAERFRTANLRIIAATNGNLEALVEQRRFRADLFFRLNILPLRLMPLRERHSDIPLLAECFLRSSSLAGQVTKRFTLRAIEALCDYSWPGNVRELYNLVQRAVVLGEHTEIDAEDLLPNNPCASTTRATGPELSFREAKARAVAEFEKNFVESLLRRCQGNISRASREAGKDRRAFGRLVKKYSLGGCVRVDAEPPSMSDG